MRLFMLILSLIVCSNIWGQSVSLPIAPLNINLKYINQTDSLGNKDGYWCEVSDDIVSLCLYASGVKNGFAQVYGKVEQDKYYLLASGYYRDDMQANQWLFFYDNGMVATSQTKISKNTCFLKEARDAGFYDPDATLQCYIVNYDINGKATSEGWCVFHDDVEADAEEVGMWKYQTPQGVKIVDKSLEN